MSHEAIRSLGAEAAIGLAVCLGVYFGVVQPLERRTDEAREQAKTLRTQQMQLMNQMTEAQARAVLAQARDFQRMVAARSKVALTESAMFAEVMDLAERHGVRIDQLQPSAVRAGRPADGESQQGRESRRCYSMVLSAEYAALAGFLDDLQHAVGFTKLRSVKVSVDGRPGSRRVLASIESEHLAFAAVQHDQGASAEAAR